MNLQPITSSLLTSPSNNVKKSTSFIVGTLIRRDVEISAGRAAAVCHPGADDPLAAAFTADSQRTTAHRDGSRKFASRKYG